MEYLIFEDSARGGPYPTEDKILAHCESKRYTPLDKPNIDAVRARMNSLVTVDVEGKDANYLRTQLNKRIEARNLSGLKVSVVNDTCYLEKV